MEAVALLFTPGVRVAFLRPLTGAVEAELCAAPDGSASTRDRENNSGTALRLLRALVAEDPAARDPSSGGSLSSDRVAGLAVPDRDRLLARVLAAAYGDRVEATLHCDACAKPFDVDFSLGALLESLGEGRSDEAVARAIGDGRYETEGGLRFRVPSGDDELATIGMRPEAARLELARRCLDAEADVCEETVARLERALEHVAPTLDLELAAPCPTCGRVAQPRFDVQRYLLDSLARDHPRLLREVHQIARAYGWSRSEILEMTRTARRQHVTLIEADRGSRRSERMLG